MLQMALIREKRFDFLIKARLSTEIASEAPEAFAPNGDSPGMNVIAHEGKPACDFPKGDFVWMESEF